jgi:hypothetical protein
MSTLSPYSAPPKGPPVFDRKVEPVARGTEWSAILEDRDVIE